MADTVGEKLMAQLHAGTDPSRFEEREEEVDATTMALWEQAGHPGGPPAIRKHEAAVRQEQQKAEQAFDARVQERAKKLRSEGVAQAEETARRQLQHEASEARDKAEHRASHERMRASTLAEYAAASTEGLRKRDEQARAERKKRSEERDARLVASILAELRGTA
ncbi:hypothetical protein ACIGW1_18450 [Streptomyces sp. NPDC053780]|uniref:hypothetical protein n=1 Tax=unclassified Streptomyces TaxID=2593676 RepID=UPI00342B01C7